MQFHNLLVLTRQFTAVFCRDSMFLYGIIHWDLVLTIFCPFRFTAQRTRTLRHWFLYKPFFVNWQFTALFCQELKWIIIETWCLRYFVPSVLQRSGTRTLCRCFLLKPFIYYLTVHRVLLSRINMDNDWDLILIWTRTLYRWFL